jgi:hypothetical protein
MTDWDDEWEEDAWVKEEPDCPPCNDSGFIGRRHCASCNPTRLQRLLFRWVYGVAMVVRRRNRRGLPEEAPF